MKNYRKYFTRSAVFGFIISSGMALAQPRQQKIEAPPTAPHPTPGADRGVVEQAGIGSNMSYARAGVMELGGSGSLAVAKDHKNFSLSPSVGWFFMDNWELTGVMSWSIIKAGSAKATTLFSLLAEPSFNYPFSDTSFGFIGIGLGVMTQTGADTGFALGPRIGWKTLVGRSGMLTLDLRDTFATNDIIETSRGAVLTVSNAFSIGAGYTVLW